MNKERGLKYWKLNKENSPNKRWITTWVKRKEFKELTKDKNCFGRIIEGIHPEKMTSDEYDKWIESLPRSKLKL